MTENVGSASRRPWATVDPSDTLAPCEGAGRRDAGPTLASRAPFEVSVSNFSPFRAPLGAHVGRSFT